MQRFSKKRQAIYDCLCGTRTHPTADWIYQQLHPAYPDLSLGTVYRNLSQLKAAGLICSVGAVNGQERYDGNVSPHAHLVCQGCGTVVDVMDVQPPQSLIAAAQAATGYQVTGMSLQFVGLCPSCKGASVS
jgi:Fur family peroxide stress response transcriptional regulator